MDAVVRSKLPNRFVFVTTENAHRYNNTDAYVNLPPH
jgi:hypothetical protein